MCMCVKDNAICLQWFFFFLIFIFSQGSREYCIHQLPCRPMQLNGCPDKGREVCQLLGQSFKTPLMALHSLFCWVSCRESRRKSKMQKSVQLLDWRNSNTCQSSFPLHHWPLLELKVNSKYNCLGQVTEILRLFL